MCDGPPAGDLSGYCRTPDSPEPTSNLGRRMHLDIGHSPCLGQAAARWPSGSVARGGPTCGAPAGTGERRCGARPRCRRHGSSGQRSAACVGKLFVRRLCGERSATTSLQTSVALQLIAPGRHVVGRFRAGRNGRRYGIHAGAEVAPARNLVATGRSSNGWNHSELAELYSSYGRSAFGVAHAITLDLRLAEQAVVAAWRQLAASPRKLGRPARLEVLTATQRCAGALVAQSASCFGGIRLSRPAFGALTPAVREALALALVGSCTPAEIADVMETEADEVKRNLVTGIRAAAADHRRRLARPT